MPKPIPLVSRTPIKGPNETERKTIVYPNPQVRAEAVAARQGTTVAQLRMFLGSGFEGLRRDLLRKKAMELVVGGH